MSRNFVIDSSDLGKKDGVFTGKIPSQAARKAFHSLCKDAPRKKEIAFAIRETGTDLAHHYKGTKTTLKEPKVVEIAGKKVTYKYEFAVKLVARTNAGCEPRLNKSPRISK